MEILFVTRPIVPPWSEGSKKLTWQIASHLRRHTPHLLTTFGEFRPQGRGHVHWHSIYRKKTLALDQKIRLLCWLALSPPCVHVFHFFFVPTLLTSRILRAISRFHGKRTVQTIPSLPAQCISPERVRDLIFAERVVVYSQSTLNKMLELGILNAKRINAGIDFVHFAKTRSDSQLRQRLGIADEGVLILYAGEYARLGSVKVLKSIMHQVIAKSDHCHFLIACRILSQADLIVETQFRRMVEDQKMGDRVHFLGEVADFAALLKACDIFLYPVTDMRGKMDTPLTVLEAMAAGLPIVSNDVAPLNEIFADNEMALVPSYDNALVARLLQLAENPELRRSEGKSLLGLVTRRYGMQQMAKAYETLYDSLG